MTLSQALIGETIPPRDRARYQGYLAAVAMTSNAFGPVAGGYLTEHLGWQSVFLINLPVGAIALVLTFRLKVHPHAREPWGFDVPGLVLFVLFVAPILLALQQGQRMDTRALPSILGLLGLSIASLAALLFWERRATSPLLPLALLRQPAIWRSDALAACHGATLVALIAFLPIFMQVVHGTSAAQTGLLMLPLTIGIGIGSMVTGRIVSVTGRTAIFPSYGLILVLLNLLFLGLWAPQLGLSVLPWVFLWNGLFMGTVMGVVQVTVQSVSGPRMLGAAAASVQFSRSIGAALGTAVVAAVLFAVLAATDRETAKLFEIVVQQGPSVIAKLPAGRQALVQAQIGDAFRAAFLTIAAFSGVGLVLAFSIPLRRI